jgi:L-aspartate oxidase
MEKVDILVIGSGIAGLSFSLEAATSFPDKKILLVSKGKIQNSNSFHAQGGIAAVWDSLNDNFEKHISDTLIAGAGLCNPEVVQMVVKEAPEMIRKLINWGVHFDKEEQGELSLRKEGGHSARRIMHIKDRTGAFIIDQLFERLKQLPNVKVQEEWAAIDLLIRKERSDINETFCIGALFFDLNDHRIIKVPSAVTLLATGGAGQIYQNTTNPIQATGDGIALASRAGAEIENMEFVQFHPTALYEPGENPAFLITEALRGAGAVLRNSNGESFMLRYDDRGSLAPRDVVARAIHQEMIETEQPFVYLDATIIKEEEFLCHFPTIYRKCSSLGIDPLQDYIPVTPAAHYFCGGVKVNKHAETSLQNLFAVGECASTGLHGANRLASNSLLEALVFASRAKRYLQRHLYRFDNREAELIKNFTSFKCEKWSEVENHKERVKSLMNEYCYIVRKPSELKCLVTEITKILKDLDLIKKEEPFNPQVHEVSNMATVALLVAKGAMNRKLSVGSHCLIYKYDEAFI